MSPDAGRRRARAGHVVAGLFACALLPGYSRAAGAGGLSWTMFSRSASFRLQLIATDREGKRHVLHPGELAPIAEPALHAGLRAGDQFRTSPLGPTFRLRLTALAALVCKVGPYASARLSLEERASLDAPIQVTHADVDCPGP